MKYVFNLSLLFITISVFGMENGNSALENSTFSGMENGQVNARRTQILTFVKSKIEQHYNQKLLAIARQTNLETFVKDITNYYHCGQPKNQTSVWAYLKNPVINIYKTVAYLQLLRESSNVVRKEAEKLPIEQREYAPVDSEMFARTNQLWPLVSVQYELSEQADRLDIIHFWAHKSLSYWHQENHEESQQALNMIANDSQAIRDAIARCKQICEN